MFEVSKEADLKELAQGGQEYYASLFSKGSVLIDGSKCSQTDERMERWDEQTGNTNRRGRLNTIPLLIEVTWFVKK
jgi:hypothetical protein